MKKLILVSAITAAFAGPLAHAQEAATAATSEHVVAYNVGVASEYRYRGISQSQKHPALSAGADYTHSPTGLYAGTWLSTIQWIKATGDGNSVPGISGPLEWDIYAGKRGEIVDGVSYDVGGLYYYYPGNELGKVSGFVNANTFELYGQVAYGPGYLKYSHSLTDTFGNANSKNSYYVDAGINQPLAEGVTLNLHVGYQKLQNATNGSYTDWKIGVTKDFGFVVGSLAYIDTDVNRGFYTLNGKFNGAGTVVATLVKNF